ncbi:MAG: hypothetical protein IKP78_10610 [Ruminococcus sp.]|nr:hypothetical protein [Ruminococcus sp.]
MKIQTTRKANYDHNLGCKLDSHMINGQGTGDVSKLKYGLFHMSYNGCEVISVYNALCYIGKPQPLQDIAFYLEKYRVLMGVFGCNVFRLGKALKKYGAAYERIDEIGTTPAFIVSFWTGKPFRSAIHTVFCTQDHGRIRIYNRYNSCKTIRYVDSPEQLLKNRKPVVVYAIKK